MSLNGAGLSIGTSMSSANLHVMGNGVIENGQLSVGGNASESTLHVHGSIGFNQQSISSNVVLGGNSIIFANTGSGKIALHLPVASSVDGRVYTVKKMSAVNDLFISGSRIDNSSFLKFPGDNVSFPSVSLMSGSGNWYITSIQGSSEYIGMDNLIGRWMLDEDSGISATNSGSSGNNGTLAGGMTFLSNGVSGPVNRALTFDGMDDDVDLGDIDGYEFGVSDKFTISIWVKPAKTTSGQSFFGRTENNGSVVFWTWCFYTEGNAFSFGMGTGAAFSYTSNFYSSFSINTWYHIVIVVPEQGGTVNYYVNGTVSATTLTRTVGQLRQSSGPFHIGGAAYGNVFFQGEIDDVRIYNKMLTSAQIQMLYQLGR